MQQAEMDKVEVKSQFARRKRNQLIVVVPFVAALMLMMLSEGKDAVMGVPITIILPVAGVLIVAVLVYSIINWRCPACNKYLGKAMSPKFCTHCGAELS